ncbi:hypothetical protein NDU88_002547 [Pleurodeles waltl]|uniref:Uncharacterized protein n=1 Tax=Pleurodeles waltl TaxID=8319 RepID=A0AAV7TKZ6_PLEWA|nr:hypothetical protein NDU88_002547 [Pleurodeles waltl]
MLVFRDWALMFVRSLKLPVRLGAYGMRGSIRGCVLRWQMALWAQPMRTSVSTEDPDSLARYAILKDLGQRTGKIQKLVLAITP